MYTLRIDRHSTRAWYQPRIQQFDISKNIHWKVKFMTLEMRNMCSNNMRIWRENVCIAKNTRYIVSEKNIHFNGCVGDKQDRVQNDVGDPAAS